MSLPRLLLRLLMGRRLPTTAGELTIAGPQAAITIRRDKFGIPHIDAENDHDAAFGLGFCQGQDRCFQLESLVRLIRGTLCELVGEAALPVDRLSRRIGFRRAADAQLLALDADVRDTLASFVAGVNAGSAEGLKQWPHEFALLKATPTPWEPADVLGFVKFISFQLPSNWDVELARLKVLRADGAKAVLAATPLDTPIDALQHDLAALAEFAPRGGGSNNWVIAGSRTATGQPLLASDPHLGPTVPAPWYLAHLRTPAWAIAGAAFAGSPVFPIAHNGYACWGVTAGLTDNTDLFLETLGPDGRSVKAADGSFVACEVRREVIRVKGSADVIEEVLITPRGPLISPLLDGEPEAISLRAVWLDSLPLRGFLDSPRAKSFAQFRTAFAAWPGLPLNVVYADESGIIGYQLIGQIPKRAEGHGTLPRPATLPGWEGLVPFADMPWMENPASGFVATANSHPYEPPVSVPCAAKPFLGSDFIDAYRATVIAEELARRTDWTVPACRQLQQNQRSKPWEEMKAIVLAVPAGDADAALGLELLRDWNGIVETDSPAAAVYELFVAEMCIRMAKASAPTAWETVLGGTGPSMLSHNLFSDRRVGLMITQLLADPPAWSAAMSDSVASVVRKLRSDVGPAPAVWAWGHLRPLHLRHALLGQHRLLSKAFNLGPIPIGGDMNTVLQAGVRPLDPLGETQNFPNARIVFDVANWSNSRFVLAGGQSGNPCSPHYANLFELWQAGDGVPIAWAAEDVIRGAVASLRLSPAAAAT